VQLVGHWFKHWLLPQLNDPNKKLRFSFSGWYFEDVAETTRQSMHYRNELGEAVRKSR
jgi:hypothetical protein